MAKPIGFHEALISRPSQIILGAAVITGLIITIALFTLGIVNDWSFYAIHACNPAYGLFYGAVAGVFVCFIVAGVRHLNDRSLQGKITHPHPPNTTIGDL